MADRYNQTTRLLSKIHAFMKNPYLQSLLFVLCTALVGVANAEKADRGKPMNVESDALRYDDLTQTSVFTGRVVLTKGTIIIRGAQLTVHEDPEGYQYGVAIAEPGKRAFYRQKREGLDEFIEGEGETIEYDGKADTVKFIKDAQLRRYRGAMLNDDFTGAVIFYNNTTDVFTIDNAVAKGPAGAPAGRVRAMLTPKPDDAAAAKSAAPFPSPVLRPSPSVGGEQK